MPRTPAGGADDGIILSNEDHDVIRGNTIQNVYDAGVEGINAVTNTLITGNSITQAALAGIASYYCTAWQHDIVEGNAISRSERGFWFTNSTEKCFQNPPEPVFTDNLFTNNSYSNPIRSGFAMQAALDSIAGSVHGNVLSANDFAAGKVSLSPLEGFENGGGNVCLPGGTFGC